MEVNCRGSDTAMNELFRGLLYQRQSYRFLTRFLAPVEMLDYVCK